MPLNNSENIDSQAKRDAYMQGEIARLRKLLDVKEKELTASLEKASLKNEILRVREKLKARTLERETAAIQEKKEAKIETVKESDREMPEKNFEELSTTRKAVPTKAQIKKITRQMKDADIAQMLITLVNLAKYEGVYYAVKIAKQYGNPYLLDRLHDAIVNDLYDELIKTKKLHP